MWRVGIDVGGTFTDLFAWEENTGKQVTAKVLTTKQDRSIAVLESIKKAGIEISDISYLMHGTTTATNALIERSYPDAALITAEGFRDTIEIGRQHRQNLYDPYQTKPKPVIKRRYRYTVPERTNVHGQTERPLDVDAARDVARKIRDAGIQSVAIGFINSYASGAHEAQMRDILRQECPDVHIVLSSETRPIFREHGRFVTTAVRAACMPVMVKYMDDLENRLAASGFTGKLLILKSSGGVMSAEAARNHPEDMLESGPAGGVAYGSYLTQQSGFDRILHTDVGGTSFDVSIVEDGKGLITRDHELEWEVPIVVPMLDIHSVGSGGGSIGWVDAGGSLRVGPKSAGSEPGPVCYGRGGTQPTITDANLILGRLDPTLNGKLDLDLEGATTAMQKLAEQIGLPTLETAEGMISIGCEYMAQAVKKVLIARGRDPRDFVYASFGGAGALAACFVARSMNIPKVIVPPHAGVASAFGATVMDLRQDIEQFYYSPVKNADLDRVNAILDDLEARAKKELEAQGFTNEAEIQITRSAQMRYVGQSYEVDTPLPNGRLTTGHLPGIEDAFHGVHLQEFGVSSDDFAPAFVSFSVTAIGGMDDPPPVELHYSEDDKAAIKGQREVYFDGEWNRCDVYEGEALTTHHRINGPAIIEYDHACTVLPPRTHAHVNAMGALVIDIEI